MSSAAEQRTFDAPQPPDDAPDRVAWILADFAERNPVPGLAVSVFDSTRILAECALGIRAIDRPADPMTTDTLFRLTSLTKVFTALAAMRLADAGRLALDEPIGDLFPASISLTAPLSTVTIRQLLSHTSGLVRGDVDLNVGSRDYDGLAEYTLSVGARTPFIADPGTVYSYSDQGFSLIGYLIERVTGSYFETAMRELVFEPLGMNSACFDPLAAMTYPLSQQHIFNKSRGLMRLRRFAESMRIHPCAGAFCSVHELALFGMLHLRDGIAPGSADRVMSADAVRELRNPRIDIGLDIDLRYGLGAYVGPRYGGHLAHGHEGYLSGIWTKLMLVPGLRFGIAWCDNRGPVPELISERYRAIDEILAALCAAKPTWCLPEGAAGDGATVRQKRFIGRYRRHTGRPVDVQWCDDALLITDGSTRIPLVHHHGSVFIAAEGASVPSRLPWEPHAGSNRCCVRFAMQGNDQASHATLNGIAYRRLG
jgi:CubicO group peptidase (beta-lactamase class C family)